MADQIITPTKRRDRHQRGYVYEASNAFHVRYYATEIVDGAPTRVQRSKKLCNKDRNTGHGSASAKAVQLLAEDHMRLVNADTPATTALTVVEFWDNTYLPHIESNLKPSTLNSYQQIWNQHLKAHFGTALLNDYRTPMMTNFLTKLAKTYRPRTLNHIKWLASGVFDHAVATGVCETNPIKDAKVLGKTLADGVTGAYSLEEIENIITALVDHVECQLIMALAFFMGLRKGEIQGLQWGDVDADYLHVRRNLTKGKGGLHLTTPKTRKSVRSIPIIQPVKGLLLLWRAKNPDGEFVFASNLTTLAKVTIRPALKKARLTWKGYHAGRRGLGTTLRTLTGNSNAGRDMLGHSNAQVTEAHYEAAMPEEVLKGMRLLEAKSTTDVKK
jgi:integrase